MFGRNTSQKTIIRISGTLECGGNISIGNGCAIAVERGATLTIGSGVYIGPSVRFYCENSINIGSDTSISWEVQFLDSDFHFMSDNGIVQRNNAPIIIGDHSWIGNRVTINKGSIISSWSIVASNSLVNKDYSKYGGGILAGCPAKFFKTAKKRIFSDGEERKLIEYFYQHKKEVEYHNLNV